MNTRLLALAALVALLADCGELFPATPGPTATNQVAQASSAANDAGTRAHQVADLTRARLEAEAGAGGR